MSVPKGSRVEPAERDALWNSLIDGQCEIDLNQPMDEVQEAVVREFLSTLHAGGWTQEETRDLDAPTLKRWQQWVGLKDTGKLDSRTFAALVLAKGSPSGTGSASLGGGLKNALEARGAGQEAICNASFSVGGSISTPQGGPAATPTPAPATAAAPRVKPPPPGTPKALSTLLLHIDALRPDVLKRMIASGQLPHLGFFVTGGKATYAATTITPSETNTILPATYASTYRPKTPGWWFYERGGDDPTMAHTMQNLWMGVLNIPIYQEGVQHTPEMQVQEVVLGLGGKTASGMTTQARREPLRDTGTAYGTAGRAALGAHTYFDQAHDTQTSLIDIMRRDAMAGTYSSMMRLLLAPADEFGHLEGVALAFKNGQPVLPPTIKIGNDELRPGATTEATFRRQPKAGREHDPNERVFQILEEDERPDGGGRLARLRGRGQGPFKRIERDADNNIVSFTMDIPAIMEADGKGGRIPKWVNPRYALALAVVDIEVGRFINAARNTSFKNGAVSWVGNPSLGIDNLKSGEESLLQQLTVIGYGDHGMVDTPYKYGPYDPSKPDPYRKGGPDKSIARFVADQLWSEDSPVKLKMMDDNEEPLRTKFPHLDNAWQSQTIRQEVAKTRGKVEQFVERLKTMAGSPQAREIMEHPVLGQLLSPLARLVKSRGELPASAKPYAEMLINTLVEAALNRNPDYAKAAARARLRLLDAEYGLIHGGAARSWCQFHIPTGSGNGRTFGRRPSGKEIETYVGDDRQGATLPEILRQTPGTGLVMYRLQNERVDDPGPLGTMQTVVLDAEGRKGIITTKEVQDDQGQAVLVFRYDPDANGDPLDIDRSMRGCWKTYEEWLQWENDAVGMAQARGKSRPLHNVVAGWGQRLYDKSTRLGDIFVLHAPGWNYGDNTASHGGSEPYENITAMFAWGPGIQPGELRAVGRHRAVNNPDGTVQVVREPVRTPPSVVMVTPTALDQLGITPEQVGHFRAYEWKEKVRQDINNLPAEIVATLTTGSLETIAHAAGLKTVDQAKAFLHEFLGFLNYDPAKIPDVPDTFRMDGTVLPLNQEVVPPKPPGSPVHPLGRLLDEVSQGHARIEVPMVPRGQLGKLTIPDGEPKMIVSGHIVNGRFDFEREVLVDFVPDLTAARGLIHARDLHATRRKSFWDYALFKDVQPGAQVRVNLQFLRDPVITKDLLGLDRLPDRPSELMAALCGGTSNKETAGGDGNALSKVLRLDEARVSFDLAMRSQVSRTALGHKISTSPEEPIVASLTSSVDGVFSLRLPMRLEATASLSQSQLGQAVAGHLRLPERFRLEFDVKTRPDGKGIDPATIVFSIVDTRGGVVERFRTAVSATGELQLLIQSSHVPITRWMFGRDHMPLTVQGMLTAIREHFGTQ